ncbi:hypothetical protein [Candidatus Methylocalor cossyra]|uniref:Uncharacterized protein n=1 Tax=Candidatus Methylocalor cossyra TaxID=3108543 RepID=A0ABM9NEN9_9GAMM
MKILAAVMALFAIIYFMPAFMARTDEVSGKTRAAVYKSAVKVKRYLPTDDRVLFDTAFGILDKIKSQEGPDAFVAAVDGKSPEEIVQMAKQEVNAKIAAGDPEFKKYGSWDEMVRALTEETGKKPGKHSDAEGTQPLRHSSRGNRPE